MNHEQEIMQIIVNGGDARSSALKAIQSARKGDLQESDELMARAKESLVKAHGIQTKLIQAEIRGEPTEMSLLLVHAQDHLMNAITVKDLAVEIIEENKKRRELEEKMKGAIRL